MMCAQRGWLSDAGCDVAGRGRCREVKEERKKRGSVVFVLGVGVGGRKSVGCACERWKRVSVRDRESATGRGREASLWWQV